MTRIHILAGDFTPSPRTFFIHDTFDLWPDGKVKADQIEILEIATSESVKKLGGTLGWGAAGAVALGPVGMLAGLMLGGKKTEITFLARFKDGRKLIGKTDPKTWARMLMFKP